MFTSAILRNWKSLEMGELLKTYYRVHCEWYFLLSVDQNQPSAWHFTTSYDLGFVQLQTRTEVRNKKRLRQLGTDSEGSKERREPTRALVVLFLQFAPHQCAAGACGIHVARQCAHVEGAQAVGTHGGGWEWWAQSWEIERDKEIVRQRAGKRKR